MSYIYRPSCLGPSTGGLGLCPCAHCCGPTPSPQQAFNTEFALNERFTTSPGEASLPPTNCVERPLIAEPGSKRKPGRLQIWVFLLHHLLPDKFSRVSAVNSETQPSQRGPDQQHQRHLATCSAHEQLGLIHMCW